MPSIDELLGITPARSNINELMYGSKSYGPRGIINLDQGPYSGESPAYSNIHDLTSNAGLPTTFNPNQYEDSRRLDPKSSYDAFKAAIEEAGIEALRRRELMPTYRPEGFLPTLTYAGTEMAKDLPYYVAGGMIGAAGTLETGPGAALGGLIGTFVLPRLMRKYYEQRIKSGIPNQPPGPLGRRKSSLEQLIDTSSDVFGSSFGVGLRSLGAKEEKQPITMKMLREAANEVGELNLEGIKGANEAVGLHGVNTKFAEIFAKSASKLIPYAKPNSWLDAVSKQFVDQSTQNVENQAPEVWSKIAKETEKKFTDLNLAGKIFTPLKDATTLASISALNDGELDPKNIIKNIGIGTLLGMPYYAKHGFATAKEKLSGIRSPFKKESVNEEVVKLEKQIDEKLAKSGEGDTKEITFEAIEKPHRDKLIKDTMNIKYETPEDYSKAINVLRNFRLNVITQTTDWLAKTPSGKILRDLMNSYSRDHELTSGSLSADTIGPLSNMKKLTTEERAFAFLKAQRPSVNAENPPDMGMRTAKGNISQVKNYREAINQKRELINKMALEKFGPERVKIMDAAIKDWRKSMNEVKEMAIAVGDDFTVKDPRYDKWSVKPSEDGKKYHLMDADGNAQSEFSTKKEAIDTLHTLKFVPFRERTIDEYFSHIVKNEVFENPKLFSKIQEHVIETGQIPKLDPSGRRYTRSELMYLAKMRLFASRNAEIDRRYGNLQIARTLDLPSWAYENDPLRVGMFYIPKAIERIMRAKYFGVKNEVYNDLVEKIRFEGGEKMFEMAKDLRNRYLGIEDVNNITKGMVKAVTGFNVVTRMGLSSLSQIPQTLNALYHTNMRSFVKSFRWVNGLSREEINDLCMRSSVGMRYLQEEALAHIRGSSSLAESYLKGVGFNKMDNYARIKAVMSGRFYVDWLADRLKKNNNDTWAKKELVKFDLNPEEIAHNGYAITEQQRIMAGRKCEIDTNYRSRIQDLPIFWSSPGGRLITQFMSFSYLNGKFVWERIAKDAARFVASAGKEGRIAPLLYSAVIGQCVGELANDIRMIATGRNPLREDTNILQRIFENYAQAGLLGMFERLVWMFKYGEPPLGPSVGTLNTGFRVIGPALRGNFAPMAKTAITWGLGPLGPITANTIFPPKQNK